MTTRFAFGDNWLDFATDLTEAQISESERSLERLLGKRDLSSLSFLDVGSGSGLSSLAARRMGARVTSFDFDANAVVCTQLLRDRFRPNDVDWSIRQGSILDKEFLKSLGAFDIVYSWGVIHHTGAMWVALTHAAGLVEHDGVLAIAVYQRTPLCSFWRIEKWIYARASALIQTALRSVYKCGFILGLLARRRHPISYINTYNLSRGMNWHHDVHDWLGGYPYESASAIEIKQKAARLGLQLVRSFERPTGVGLFGTGCNEYVFRLGQERALDLGCGVGRLT